MSIKIHTKSICINGISLKIKSKSPKAIYMAIPIKPYFNQSGLAFNCFENIEKINKIKDIAIREAARNTEIIIKNKILIASSLNMIPTINNVEGVIIPINAAINNTHNAESLILFILNFPRPNNKHTLPVIKEIRYIMMKSGDSTSRSSILNNPMPIVNKIRTDPKIEYTFLSICNIEPKEYINIWF